MDTNNLIESIDARECFRRSHATSLCSSFLFKSRSFVSPVLSDLFATLSRERGGRALTPFSLIAASNQITICSKKRVTLVVAHRIGYTRELSLSSLEFSIEIYRFLGTRKLSVSFALVSLILMTATREREREYRRTRTRTRTRFAALLRYH